MEISPKYLMKLIDQVEKAIWQEFSSYRNVRNYIKKWHQLEEINFNDYQENFKIYQDNGQINLNETLHGIDPETLIKIAADLGIETPGFIPAIPLIKNTLRDNYPKAFTPFQKALEQIEENPDLAVGLANSTLESIIKHILEDNNFGTELNKKDTLYKLTSNILKEFCLFPTQSIPHEIRDIGSSLLNISQSIEKLRSEKTMLHGKTRKDYIVKDSIYAQFIINAVSTVGLFLMNFYENKYKKSIKENVTSDTKEKIEIKVEDIPF